MAKVAAAPGSVSQIGGAGDASSVGPMFRRKTPSELRGEQLKNSVVELEGKPTLPGSIDNTGEVHNGLKKPDFSKNPRYIDTRMDELYPVKKSRLRRDSVKENVKENESAERVKNLSLLSTLAAKRRQLSCGENAIGSPEVSKDSTASACETIEKSSGSEFCLVSLLSFGGEKSHGLAVDNMDKALKGLVAHEPSSSAGVTCILSEKFGTDASPNLGNFCSECPVLGQKAPLDFTLKTKMRLASSCSVSWIHRSIMHGTYNGVPQFTSQFGGSSPGQALASQVLSSKALHSWIYPQSTLPLSVISALTSSAAGGVEMDFLRKRQLAWQDSFRNLYYMFRKNICNMFYVYTSHFVVMFTGGDASRGGGYCCNAYISQSTRALRSLLRENDLVFSMPLCHSKMEQVATEDLVELSEIERRNLGQVQTRQLSSFSDIDNSPQSLLAFRGNKNVHGLFDILVNYRSFLTYLSGADVPVLYSPFPFLNAALSAPEIRCVEIKTADHNSAPSRAPKAKDGESVKGLSTGLRSSIEIKDTCIPPWIICRVCELMGSEGGTFEASFTTESTSIGLNVALQTVRKKSDSQAMDSEGLYTVDHAFGIPEATVTSSLCFGFLKGLKYGDGSYTASLSPV